MNKCVVETKNLTKRFGNLTAVDNINIYVNKGEIIGFLGPNGAGKTTTISMLSTIIKPTSGDAFIEGYSILKESNEVRKRIGVVPQEIIIYDYLSPKENCEFFAKMHRISQNEINNRLKLLFNTLGLEEKMHVKSSTLSGGQKRRLNLIMGLIMNPDIVFLDEPTAGLDPQGAHLTWEYIRSLRDNEEKTIILTTHNMHEAEELSDRIYIIDHGRVIADGTPQALRANIGEGEIFDLKFKDELDLKQLKIKIENLGSYISKVNILGKDRMVISAIGGVKRLMEIEQILPNKLESLDNLNIRGNNLEDVFLVLTGRTLRE
ncbi:MAG: ABC transporter ATP-binding protein [Candidatus Lokiarchaeota archaeon]|nr:ABC transporter ATP-binding protein [Candidatus Lokiarchaeota archaeon]